MKTAIAAAMIAGLALTGASAAGVASARTEFPVHSGFSSEWACVNWMLDYAGRGNKQYECRDFGANGGWTLLWIVD
ncbi:hypothetical protein [Nocardia sp. NPDC056000]|uniref:hypothetical protein n=1 Tax=Nocardia sp. NPDC056000 TaxID=3345674 RepID=UPI0035D97EF7